MTQDFNWWDDCNLPDLSTGAPQFYWASQAMCEAAIKHGIPSCKYTTVNGTATQGVNELIQAFEELGGRKVKENLPGPYNDDSVVTMLVWPNGAVEVSGDLESNDVEVNFGSNDPELFQDMFALAKTHLKRTASRGRVYAVISGSQGPQLQAVGLAGVPLVRDNYVPSVVEAFDHVVEDLSHDTPCGRIVIFDGPPGSGKTFCVKALLDAVPNGLFVMVPAAMVQDLAGPHLISALLRHQTAGMAMILVVEDADEVLVRRDGGNMGSISSLLNISDGILGATLNIRVVATTNAGHLKSDEDLDDAIMRPGRLCRRIHVPTLPVKQAEEVYQRLTGAVRELAGPMTVAEVYRMARDGGWKPKPTRKSVGFNVPSRPVPFDPEDY